METIKTQVIAASELPRRLDEVAPAVLAGAIIVYPTDTVYGIGASIDRPDDVHRIFIIKGRTLRKPMALLISRKDAVDRFVEEITPEARALMDAFWPGPLTLVLPVKKGSVPEIVNGGGGSIGVRLPDDRSSLRLIDACGGVLATTSANTSSLEDAVTFQMAYEYFNGRVEYMIDGGSSPIGIPSSVVSCTEDGVTVLREGGITEKRIRECCAGA